MFGFFSLFTGRKYSNEIADYLKIDRRLYSSALLEAGVSWGTLKPYQKNGTPIEKMAFLLMPSFIQGLAIIKQRFGEQPTIISAEYIVRDWISEHEQELRDAATEEIVSSEYPNGRFKLTYPIYREEQLRGEVITHESTYALYSDDLEELKSLALVKQLGGADISLIDTETGHAISI